MAYSSRQWIAPERILPWLAMIATASLSAAVSAQPAPTSSDQAQIEAAKRHPIATPEPRPLYPEESPPPRSDARPLYPAERPQPRPTEVAQAPAAPRPAAPPVRVEAPPAEVDEMEPPETTVVAPYEPPPVRVEVMAAAPAPGYVWAPGYWYWYGGAYTWIAGSWIWPRAGYVYLGPRWVHTYNGWAFTSGGWSVGGRVAYPVYRHGYLWGRPYRGGYYSRYGRPYNYRSPGPAYRYNAPAARYNAPAARYNAPPARYNAPPAAYRRSAPAAPAYRYSAPRASGGSVRREAPAAVPRASHHRH